MNSESDTAITAAVTRIPGLCRSSLSRERPNVIDAITAIRADPSTAVCVAELAHAGHEHFVAAILTMAKDDWTVERATQTDEQRGIPRSAPAVFTGPDGGLSIAGWATNARARQIVAMTHSFRSPPIAIERGMIVAHFGPDAARVGEGGQIAYLDENGETLLVQGFNSAGGIINEEVAARRERTPG